MNCFCCGQLLEFRGGYCSIYDVNNNTKNKISKLFNKNVGDKKNIVVCDSCYGKMCKVFEEKTYVPK